MLSASLRTITHTVETPVKKNKKKNTRWPSCANTNAGCSWWLIFSAKARHHRSLLCNYPQQMSLLMITHHDPILYLNYWRTHLNKSKNTLNNFELQIYKSTTLMMFNYWIITWSFKGKNKKELALSYLNISEYFRRQTVYLCPDCFLVPQHRRLIGISKSSNKSFKRSK